MKVSIIANALAGLGPAKVGALSEESWRRVRPQDDLRLMISSDGVRLPSIGTGLVEVFAHRHSDVHLDELNEPRRIVCMEASTGEALIDLAEALGEPALNDLFGSTAFLGDDLLALIDAGIRRIQVHLPQIMSHTDVGVGMLGVLAGDSQLTMESTAEQFREAIGNARRRLGATSIVFTYPTDLALTGVSGLARKLDSVGYPADDAQHFERELGSLVARLSPSSSDRTASSRAPLFSTSPASTANPHAVFAGVGGGLGFMLTLLGGTAVPLGQYLHRDQCTDCELSVYITDHIGLEFPAGLAAVAAEAQETGVPVVVILREGHMRRGELPRYGIHGTYYLKTAGSLHLTDGYRGDAPASTDDELATLASVSDALSATIHSVAHTWGWD